MMSGILFATLASVGCAQAPNDDLDSFELQKGGGTSFEPTWTNHNLCYLDFAGSLGNATDQYLIWNVGTNGIVNAPYDTARPDLWAIFGTGAPAAETHHVDGYSGFDHYHVAQSYPGLSGYDAKYDVITAWPGPNFVADGYVTAKNDAEVQAQIASGVLVRLTLPEIGFPPLVLFAPIVCL